jgi:hypothetical protein
LLSGASGVGEVRRGKEGHIQDMDGLVSGQDKKTFTVSTEVLNRDGAGENPTIYVLAGIYVIKRQVPIFVLNT